MSPERRRMILIIGGVVLLIIIALSAFVFLQQRNSQTADNGLTEIVYWGLWEPKEVMEEVVANYEAENPTVDIIYTQRPFAHRTDPAGAKVFYSGAYATGLVDRLLEPDSVDVIQIHNSWLPRLRPLLSPAPGDLITVQEYQEIYYPVAYEDFVDSEGNIYAVPYGIDGLVLFYNRDLFQQAGISDPPANWDEVVLAARRLRELDSDGEVITGGIGLGTGSNIDHAYEILMMMFTQANVTVVNEDNDFTFDVDRAEQAINFYLEFASQEEVWSYRLANDFSLFVSGQLGMMIAPSWKAHDVVDQNQSLNFDIAKLPVLPGANPDTPQYYATYWAEAVSANSSNPVEAWNFIYYLSQPEQQRIIYDNASSLRLFGQAYSRRDMNSELRDAPYVGPIMEMAPTMKSWRYGDTAAWEEKFRNLLISVESSSEPSVSVSDLEGIRQELVQERQIYEQQVTEQIQNSQ